MLEKLLQEIQNGGTLETRSLALRLGISPQMVEVLLEHLQRSGQIKPYETCGDGCQGCSLKSDCGAPPPPGRLRLWQTRTP